MGGLAESGGVPGDGDGDGGEAGASGTGGMPPGVNSCMEIPYLPAAPQIDGELDPGVGLFDVPVGVWRADTPDDTPDLPAGNSARLAVAWRPDGIYVFVEVLDPFLLPDDGSGDGPWQGDGIEIYLDDDAQYTFAPSYDDPGTVQFICGAPTDQDSSVDWCARYAWDMSTVALAPQSAFVRSFATPDGYVFEGFFQGNALGLTDWTLNEADEIGFNFGHNVSTTGSATDQGFREGQYFLEDDGTLENRPFVSTNGFCTTRLLPP